MTDENFTHLHCHSYFSLLDGLSSIKDMVSCAANMGYKFLALTDHGTCAGLYQFQKVCNDKGIKPILGMEGYICDDHSLKEKGSQYYHIILLAKNIEGYKNLIYLSSFGSIHGFYYKPRIDFKVLEAHKEGLIVSTACIGGEIPSLLLSGNQEKAESLASKYKDVFKDDFYLEIMLHKYINDKSQEDKERKVAALLYKMGKKLGIKAIATQDSHYVRKADWEAHDVLLSVQTLDTIKNPERMSFNSQDFYLKPYEEMLIPFKSAPDLLLNTVEISEKIGTNLIVKSQDLLPSFDLPEGFTKEEDYLKEIVTKGMEQKGLKHNPVYRERIRMEMNVIISCKYTRYFLILWDIVNFARRQGIRCGVGRGSAVSSLCLYVMDVTRIDPLQYDLIFERFLNPERISPPDVDMDFDYDRRDEVYNYILSKYGPERCSQIGTYNKFKARAVIKSTAKALDIGEDWDVYQKTLAKNPEAKVEMTKNTLNLADAIAKQVPFKATMTIEMALKQSQDFKNSMHKYPKLLECARHIEGTLSSAGVHPAGILVCKDPVIDRIPLRNAKGVICSQYDGGEVEDLGLLKFDLLALKTLTVIDKTMKIIQQRHPDKLPKDFDIDALVPNDPNIFRILNGTDETRNTLGVFQFEAFGISKLLTSIHVDRFEDMIIANALYRPGPLGAGMHDMYCDYKHNRKKVEYLHPKIGEVLKDTYGIMIYQENIMRVAQKLAGFTGGQADTLRKAVGKKKKDLLQEMKKLFVSGCAKNDISSEIATKIFEQIEFFGDYGFNKCLSGDTLVYNKRDGSYYTLKELERIFRKSNNDWRHVGFPVIIDSYVDGKIVEDEVIDVFETGEKEIAEVKLINGMIIKCTLDHRFYCSDGLAYTVSKIREKDLEILYEEKENILKCKIKSIRSMGRRTTYNVTMKGRQHNYKIASPSGIGVYTKNSHSAAYAYIAYQTAWLKMYYPIEFMCNLLTSEINNNDKNEKLEQYIAAARRMKIGVTDPTINLSGLEFKIVKIEKKKDGSQEEGLIKPLTFMKGVGDKAVRNIVENQPYKNLEDFVRKTDARVVNTKVFSTLVEAGCMDESWKVSRAVLLQEYGEVKKKFEKERKNKAKQEKDLQILGGNTLLDEFKSSDQIKV